MVGGRGLQAFASEQRRQAGHGAWRPRGGRRLTRSGAWCGDGRGAREKEPARGAGLGRGEVGWRGRRAAAGGFGRGPGSEAAAREREKKYFPIF